MRSPQQRDRLDAVQIDIETGPTSTVVKYRAQSEFGRW
jgi:hypothetical protein